MKYTGINLQTLQDKDLFLTLENSIRGVISSVLGDRYVKPNDNKRVLYFDAKNLYSPSRSQPLPYDEIKLDKNVKLEDIFNTNDGSDIGYLLEVDLKNSEIIKQKKNFL